MVLLQQLEKEGKPIQNYCSNSETYSKQVGCPQGEISTNTTFHYKTLLSKPLSKAEAKELAAKKHSEAERRRRLRINGQFDTLRSILPNLVKVDKASVLEETIRRVRELQNSVKELKTVGRDRDKCAFPSEANEVTLRYSIDDGGLLKVTLSCEDRPGLMSDLQKALRSARARVVRAEMVTVGDRTKCELLVQGFKGNEGTVMLKRALNLAIGKPSLVGNGKKLGLCK